MELGQLLTRSGFTLLKVSPTYLIYSVLPSTLWVWKWCIPLSLGRQTGPLSSRHVTFWVGG